MIGGLTSAVTLSGKVSAGGAVLLPLARFPGF